MPSRMTIAERTEYAQKPEPLTMRPGNTVREAVAAMSAHNYGCVVVTEEGGQIVGILTERDILKRLVDRDLDPATTRVGEIMTSNPRVARRDDPVVDWLRIMSNERFRRLPVVDEHGMLEAIFTQGDFVSYTWPELTRDGPAMVASPAVEWRPVVMIAGLIGVYTLLMAVIFTAA